MHVFIISMINAVKVYVIFALFALVFNLGLELLISPENRAVMEEQGVGWFLKHVLGGIFLFYLLYDVLGTALFFKLSPKYLGLASMLIGMFLEFTFMKPDWVVHFNIGGFLVSSLFWFLTWYGPAKIIDYWHIA